jgi:S1-C subfamily serine protease
VTVERGVVIAEVLPATPAALGGLRRGDVILSANGTDIVSGPQLRDLIHDTKPGEDVTLNIERGAARFEVRVRLEPVPE